MAVVYGLEALINVHIEMYPVIKVEFTLLI